MSEDTFCIGVREGDWIDFRSGEHSLFSVPTFQPHYVPTLLSPSSLPSVSIAPVYASDIAKVFPLLSRHLNRLSRAERNKEKEKREKEWKKCGRGARKAEKSRVCPPSRQTSVKLALSWRGDRVFNERRPSVGAAAHAHGNATLAVQCSFSASLSAFHSSRWP